jgi:AcrR family transcriptional regulator
LFVIEQRSLSNDVLSLDRRTSQPPFDGWYSVLVMSGEQSAEGQPGMPEVPPPPWQRRPERATRRRREPISRDAIVDAAMALLDRDGYEALSMRALAEELGTGAASLYWHVGSKDGLLDLVFDKVIGEVRAPDADPERWAEQVKEFGRSQRAVALRHPFIVPLSLGRIPMGPNAVWLSERAVAIMAAGGLPPRLAVQGFLLLLSAINGFTSDETGGGEGGSPGAQPSEPPDGPSEQEMADMIARYFASLPPETFPNLTKVAGEFALTDGDERFELLLDIFVDGLTRRAGGAGRPGTMGG